MGRRKKGKQPRPQQLGSDHGMRLSLFAIEENADEIFRDYVMKNPAPNKMLAVRDQANERNKSVSADFEIDLHGMTLDEAIAAVDSLIRERLAVAKHLVNGKIITGKGRRSPGEKGVLARHVHRYVANTFEHNIVYIDESPADVSVGGVPIRGHFCVRLKKN